MSLKRVSSVLGRSLWSSGSSGSRSPAASGCSSVLRLSGAAGAAGGAGGAGGSSSSDPDRPGADVPSSTELPGAKKRPKGPVGAPGVGAVRRRSYTSVAAPLDKRSFLWARYSDLRRLVHGKSPSDPRVSPESPPGLSPGLPLTAAGNVDHVSRARCSLHAPCSALC